MFCLLIFIGLPLHSILQLSIYNTTRIELAH